MSECAISGIRRLLLSRRLPDGTWAYSAGSRQPATEPTALATLALDASVTVLERMQAADGGFSPVQTAGAQCWAGSWVTSLALLTLLRLSAGSPAARKAVNWLCASRGREGHWLWRWKFKTVDAKVRFNPDKFGWTWAPGTASWVIPTALAVLALRIVGPDHSGPELRRRLDLGCEMLLDRACSSGGWNAGNAVAFGVPLGPHVDATAIALLALQGRGVEPPEWFVRQSQTCRGVASTSWAILALDSHQPGSCSRHLDHLRELLRRPEEVEDTAALALVVLALRAECGDNVFKVTG